MPNSSEALKTINIYYIELCKGIENYKNSETFNAAVCQDAYARAARLRERYKEEKNNEQLLPGELKALSKVFDNDNFTEGMMNIRHVGEHVTKRSDFRITTTRNESITLPAVTSAMAMFSNYTVTLNDTAGESHTIDHLKHLEAFQQRCAAAIKNAENS